MSDETALVATPSQTAGPFFHIGLTPQLNGLAGERILVRVMVTDGDGRPVDDALVELWHTAEYAVPAAAAQTRAVFARMPTGEDGSCEFETVRPGRAPDGQAPHINVCLFARGLLRQLHTRLYFAGDPEVESDAVLSLVPEPRRTTLLARPDPAMPERWVFEIRLQEPQETVFFNI